MENPWTFDGESRRLAESDGIVTLVDGGSFVVSRSSGDFGGHDPHGLFLLDTRVLSEWLLLVDGEPIEPLSVIPNGPFSATFVGRRALATHPDAPLVVLRHRHVGQGMREDLEIRNHGSDPAQVIVDLRVGADFAGLFEVKAGQVTARPSVQATSDDHTLRISGNQVPVAATLVSFDRAHEQTGDHPHWIAEIAPGERWTMCLEVGVEAGTEELRPSHRCGQPVERAIPVTRLASWKSAAPAVHCNRPDLTRASDRAVEDLGALRIFDPTHADRVVVAAGAPWFMTLFGRDSLIAAWMALLVDRNLARGVLASLAEAQGRVVDPQTEEEPGRILHEVRFDQASSRLLGGRSRYYGTVDATALFVMLVAELGRWSGIDGDIEALLPAVDAALAWIELYGDRDGDGFVEYERTTETGLENQGWKDSWDGIRYRDGRVAQAPIALAEVQGYTFAAYSARADLAEALGDTESASRWTTNATALAAAFDDAFWIADRDYYAVALDGDKRQIDSLASNMGHCLWTGIVPRHRSANVARALVDSELFSGWGLRTLGSENGGYNPVSYHCGSVWPHDTALAVAGLSRYGHDHEASSLSLGLLEASSATAGRLPELFAGFDRSDLAAPVPYPTSCSPQAWAAASPLLLVRAMLGLEPDLLRGRVLLRPRLPEGMDRLRIESMSLGSDRVDIDIDGDDVNVTGLSPDIELVIE